MGKGNRTRNERAGATLATAGAQRTRNQKKPMPTWAGTAIVLGVLLVLVLFTTFCVLSSRGTFLRARTVMETENFEINGAMMSYMVHTEYQNRLSMYGSAIGGSTGINIKGDSTGDALDSSKGLRDQAYSRQTDADGNEVVVTWFDYFAGLAEQSARQVLACCEMAKYYGLELDDADREAIQSELNMIEYYAAIYGYTTSGYLGAMYGQGVALKDVQAMMELTKLASKFATLRSEELHNAVTDDRIYDYYLEHKGELDKYVDYTGYTFTTKLEVDKDGNATQEALDKYAAEQAKYAERVAKLKEALEGKGDRPFAALLEEYLREDFFEEEKEAAIKKKGEDKTWDDLTQAEQDKVNQEASKRASAAAAQAIVLNYTKPSTSSTNTNLQAFINWLFETKKNDETKKDEYIRVEGDIKEINDAKAAEKGEDEKYTAVTSTYGVYQVTSNFHRDSSVLRDVGHILFKTQTFKDLTKTDKLTGAVKELADALLSGSTDILSAEIMANALLKKMWDEGKIKEVDGYYVIDKAAFEEYGNLYTEDGNVFYEDVKEGQMVEEFEDWLFSPLRKEGEISFKPGAEITGAVETTYGYHIMMYCGNERPAWSYDIRTTLGGEDYTSYMNDLKANTNITVKEKNWKYIPD